MEDQDSGLPSSRPQLSTDAPAVDFVYSNSADEGDLGSDLAQLTSSSSELLSGERSVAGYGSGQLRVSSRQLESAERSAVEGSLQSGGVLFRLVTVSHPALRLYAHQYCPGGTHVVPRLVHR